MRRIVLEMPDTLAERLDALQAMTGSDSRVEVISKALAVYEACAEHVFSGGAVILEPGEVTHIDAEGVRGPRVLDVR